MGSLNVQFLHSLGLASLVAGILFLLIAEVVKRA